VDKLAKGGDPRAIKFPRSFLEEGSYDFSFSGIKTAVLYYLRREGLIDERGQRTSLETNRLADICASFQDSVVDVLVAKTLRAANDLGVRDIALAGGVSANSRLRDCMKEEWARNARRLFYPPLEYCMDNGAMIGYVGWMKLAAGQRSDFSVSAVANLSIS
jgi:N6-L-threonylcarbamoyladenine synthase